MADDNEIPNKELPDVENSGAKAADSALPNHDEDNFAADFDDETQANFIEAKEPSELIFCVILAAAYAGLAKYLWLPLQANGDWYMFITVEGFFITISILCIMVGARPYFSPSNLQVSKRGIKYRGPHWPKRKTVNWEKVYRLYVGPEITVVLYYPKEYGKGLWALIIQSLYLANRDKVADAFVEYSPIKPILLEKTGIGSRIVIITLFVLIVLWILQMLTSH